MAVLRSLTSIIAIFLCSIPPSAAQAPSGPCAGVSAQVSTLSACLTASKFCSLYLHSHVVAPSTLQTTTTITVGRPGPSQTVLSTTTISSGTSTLTSVSTSTTYYVTTVVTTTALTCGVQRREIDVTKPVKQTSCGFATSAIPSAISLACDCFLKPVQTITYTATVRGPATGPATTRVKTAFIPATSTTTTSTTTLTLGTSTIYSCVTPATPLRTPLPMQNFILNPSFESPALPPGGTAMSTDDWVMNSPEPYPYEWTTIINNASFAPDGSNYMSMYYDYRIGYSTNVQQSLQGAQAGQLVTVNFTYNVQMLKPDDPNDGSCSLGIALGYASNSLVASLTFYGPTNGWQTFVGTGQVQAAGSPLILEWHCNGFVNQFTDPNDPTHMSGAFNLDNVRVGVPDTSCAMNLQFYAPDINVGYGYAALGGPDTWTSPNNSLVENQSQATAYSLDEYGNLFAISSGYPLGYWRQTAGSDGNGPILSSDLGNIFQYGGSLLTCTLDPLQLLLSCSAFGGNDTFIYLEQDAYGNQVIYLAEPAQAAGYQRTLRAVYLN